ncbi:MAG: hypothetical protein FWD82_08760 [Defluviitaleaceae bacterium]|nr:hypothetical protein [Defluviitaleaceae bacterium]
MACKSAKECACPKTSCENHSNCCDCIVKHKNTDSLPFCLFLDNNGDKSLKSFYDKLKERFENNRGIL